MRSDTEQASPGAAGMGSQRQQIASLAHGKAHEVLALQAALGQIDDGMTAEQVRTLLVRMIRTRRDSIALMADEVGGHA